MSRARGPRARGHTAVQVKDQSIRHDSPSAGRIRARERPPEAFFRRGFDIAGALGLLLLALPLLAAASLAVIVTSGLPVLFGQVRVGRHGRPFRCWKLRTMHLRAEEALVERPDLRSRYVANGFKLAVMDDPRVTRMGRVLRRTYLDELPQLFNVLGGSMSLVGPRPVTEDQFDAWGSRASELLEVKPGIVGEWTALGRRRPMDDRRVDLELGYVRNRSLRRDILILVRSLPVILRGLPEDA